jgi:type I restriction enzyme S subunit
MEIPRARFREFLHYRKEFIRIDDLKRYKRARVQLHWRGVVLREEVEGPLIKTKD